MSKKLTGLLGAVLVVMLAFSAAFAADTPMRKLVKVTLDNAETQSKSSVTGFVGAGGNMSLAAVVDDNNASSLVLALNGLDVKDGEVTLTLTGTFAAADTAFDATATLTIGDGTDQTIEWNDNPTFTLTIPTGTTTLIITLGDGSITTGAFSSQTVNANKEVTVTLTGTLANGANTAELTVSKIKIDTTDNITITGNDKWAANATPGTINGAYGGQEFTLDDQSAIVLTGIVSSEFDVDEDTGEISNVAHRFYANSDSDLIKGEIDGDPATINVSADAKGDPWFSYATTGSNGAVTLSQGGVVSKDADGEPTHLFNIYLVGTVADVVFDSSDITVFDGVSTQKTSASKTKTSAELYVALSADVSIDIAEANEVISVSFDGEVQKADANGYYVISSKDMGASGDKKVVVIKFKDGLDSSDFTLTLVVSGDSAGSSETSETETYLLKVSDITLTPANAVSNTAKLISADTDNYSATRDLANLDSTASGDWGSFAEFTASSDYLGGSFSVTVSTDAKLVNVYVKNGTTWDEVDTEEVSGKVITPNTIGTYKVVLSADLIASSDKKVSGDAYFAFDFKVVSVDAAKSEEAAQDVVTDAANASADATGGVGGNPIIAGGQKIDTKFLSGTAISPSAFASFFSSATTVTMLSETELVAALETLGLDEDDMGDSENGYKALAFGLPSGFTLTANEKFFVLLTTNENGTGTNRLGVGVVSPKLDGSRTMVIVFKLLKNPAHTADFMTFDAGEYFVGATNDTASADTSSSTRAVFVTAGGTFNIKSDEATLLQGQTENGTATPYEGDDDDDDNQETSSHGSSSGCDAGFGALALLAVAGALAARKVRK